MADTWTARLARGDAGGGSAGDGDAYLEVPAAVLARLGWQEGDELEVTADDDGSFSLRKAPASGAA